MLTYLSGGQREALHKNIREFTLIRPAATFSLSEKESSRTRLAGLPLPAGEGRGEGGRKTITGPRGTLFNLRNENQRKRRVSRRLLSSPKPTLGMALSEKTRLTLKSSLPER